MTGLEMSGYRLLLPEKDREPGWARNLKANIYWPTVHVALILATQSKEELQYR